MPQYQITARRINDRPTPDGWQSSGTDMPVFWVQAASVEHAATLGHSLAGEGVTALTRTTVQAYRGTEDDVEEYVDTTQWWYDGWQVEPTQVNRQYGRNGQHIAGEMDAEQDADEVTWFTHYAGNWLHLRRTPRGLWSIDSSDHVKFHGSDYRRRFSDPADALYFAERRAGVRVVEVDGW